MHHLLKHINQEYKTEQKHKRSTKEVRFFSALCLLCLCARLFICALWSPAGIELTSWLSFVVSNCEFVTFPLVRFGTWLYQFLIFAPLLTLSCCPVFRDALKPEQLPVEPSGVPGHRNTKPYKKHWLVLVQPRNTATINAFVCECSSKAFSVVSGNCPAFLAGLYSHCCWG